MRTIITHFYNEEYLLPWWLSHHVRLFDHGILIDHGSTDNSVAICRAMAPHWRIVRSRLLQFDAYTTDWEVQGFEQEVPGWKIVLNTTEFLMPSAPLDAIEQYLVAQGKKGCVGLGVTFVDHNPHATLTYDRPLPVQKHYGIDDNRVEDPVLKKMLWAPGPVRNRFYHCHSLGMYSVGRHSSFHPDAQLMLQNLIIGHFAYAVWTPQGVQRSLQIGAKTSAVDQQLSWGTQHRRSYEQLYADYQTLLARSIDFMQHPAVGAAIQFSCQ